MVVFLYIAVLLQIFAQAVTDETKSVNLALETVLEFDKHNLDSDVKIIDNVQKFLSKIRTVLDGNRNNGGRRLASAYLQFTDFLYVCIETLKTYNDKDLQEFSESLYEEIRKYHYKGCKFYELLENKDTRQYISDKFEEFRDHPPKKLRKVLNKIQKKLQHTKSKKGKAMFSLINSLYRLDSQSKFKMFVDNLEAYKIKPKNDITISLRKIIKNGIRALIFDHYSNLNPNVRQDVKVQLNAFITPDKKPVGRNETIPTTWDLHPKQQAADNKKQNKREGAEPLTGNEKKKEDNMKRKHSKQLNQEMEHDIEAEMTNKWLFEKITTAKHSKKKPHRHGKHDNSKSNKKLRKHKKKKDKVQKKKETTTTKPLNLLFRMPPAVQENRLPDKKETPKSKIFVRARKDEPLKEILSETAAEILVVGDTTLENERPPPMDKDSQNTKYEIGVFKSFKSSEQSHSEQDKIDGLSIETGRSILRRTNEPKSNDAIPTQAQQEKTQTLTTFVETTLDPVVQNRIHNLEEELSNVKKRMRSENTDNTSTSESSEGESDSSEEQKTTKTTKSSKPAKSINSTSATPVNYSLSSTTMAPIMRNVETIAMTESSGEFYSTETEESEDLTNATTIKITTSKVESKTSASEKKSTAPPTTSFKTTTVDPPINTTLIGFVPENQKTVEKNEDVRVNQGIISGNYKSRDYNLRDLKNNGNATTAATTETSQVVITKNGVFELRFNIQHDSTSLKSTKTESTPIPKPVDIVFKSHSNETSSNVENTTKHTPEILDIVDVISVLNSTMSPHDKLEKLQSLRRNIDLTSDDEVIGIPNNSIKDSMSY